MNIKEAKETIQYTLQAYFQKDESGYPLVPLRQQRPILLVGPPGIGKTAIMEQIAGECGEMCIRDRSYTHYFPTGLWENNIAAGSGTTDF